MATFAPSTQAELIPYQEGFHCDKIYEFQVNLSPWINQLASTKTANVKQEICYFYVIEH